MLGMYARLLARGAVDRKVAESLLTVGKSSVNPTGGFRGPIQLKVCLQN